MAGESVDLGTLSKKAMFEAVTPNPFILIEVVGIEEEGDDQQAELNIYVGHEMQKSDIRIFLEAILEELPDE